MKSNSGMSGWHVDAKPLGGCGSHSEPRQARRSIAVFVLFIAMLTLPLVASGQSSAPANAPPAPLLPDPLVEAIRGGPESWTSPQRFSSTLQVMLLLTVLSLAPAILLMTTSFVRIVVVLGLLRQALGTQQLPPSQVMTTLALFMTLLVMGPTWSEI